MERLDRLGWAAGIAVVAHGVHLGVRVTDPGVMNEVVEALPPGWRHANGPGVDHLFSRLGGRRRPPPEAEPPLPGRPQGGSKQGPRSGPGVVGNRGQTDHRRVRPASRLRPRRRGRMEGTGNPDPRPDLRRQDHARGRLIRAGATYYSDGERNVLIADNHTALCRDIDDASRASIARTIWGEPRGAPG